MANTLFKAFLIFGPPGSGKGTVGAKLAATTSLKHISTGDIFRGLAPDSEGGKLFRHYAEAGKLVPDEGSVQIFAHALEDLCKKGTLSKENDILLLDGMPRTAAQTDLIKSFIDVKHMFVLDIPDEQVIVDRILGRAKVEGRKDDADVNIIRNRIQEYKVKTAAVLDCYPTSMITRIPGQNSPDEVFSDTLAAVIRERKTLGWL